jgi:hypothetical protein
VTRFLATGREDNPEMYAADELDAAWKAILPHTDPRYLEELQGLAEGSGVSLETLRHAHALPVVSPWSCSCLAVWGEATKDGGLYQIRNLDFMTEAGLQDYPVIVVYNPDEGIPHASVTFAGIVSVNTGMNAKGVALSEKGNSPADGYPYSINGAHFTSVFHTILYDAANLPGAIDILKATPWFKSYYFVVGSGSDKAGVKVKVDAPDITFWGANDPTEEEVFEPLPNAVYVTMQDQLTVPFLKQHDGEHDQNTLIALSKMVGTDNGNLLNVVYDTTRLEMWVALAEGDRPAKTRPYVHFRLRDYLE